MRRIRHTWMVSLLWVNGSVLLVVLVQTAGTGTWGARALLHTWAYSLVYANVTALPAILALPRWVKSVSESRQIFAVVLGSLAFAAVGPLAAETLLFWTAAIGIPAIFFVSWISWRQIERPFQRLGRRYARGMSG